MDFNKLLDSKEYDFLKTNPLLKDRIIFLTLGGSYSYGTNVEGSDIDVRGVFLERESDTLGLTNCEHFIDEKTDTVIYSLKKFLKLVRECNPNIIEMLFCKPQHYLYVSPLGKMLLENRHMFLTKRAAYSFGGYANAQLNRLENALARDVLSEIETLNHINRSIENVVNSFDLKYKLDPEAINTYVGVWQEGEGEEILVDINLKHYPLSRIKSMVEEMSNVIKSYSNTPGHRNNKKDDLHLNKHMMHLIRLYIMCNEILRTGDVHTYREDEHQLLMDIRTGKYRSDDGYVTQEFYNLLNSLRDECDSLKEETKLPTNVSEEDFINLVINLYKEARKND